MASVKTTAGKLQVLLTKLVLLVVQFTMEKNFFHRITCIVPH